MVINKIKKIINSNFARKLSLFLSPFIFTGIIATYYGIVNIYQQQENYFNNGSPPLFIPLNILDEELRFQLAVLAIWFLICILIISRNKHE